ncbi:hypothetical protein MNBD_UNCLBAC01-1013 [hydrothermal vent metagenome]|uniref:Uncharacterized protein n=1 Tax=hydrothermal vent metagenome TaxID=652676 RepID=A0A3B1E2W4_9ZZZZ
MKDSSNYVPLLVGFFLAGAIFIGVITTIKKSFQTKPQINSANTIAIEKKQKQHMNDIRQRQKELMRQQKQKIRDARR